MMKQLLQVGLAIILALPLYAQSFTPPAYADVDNNYRTYINNVFGALEANRVPTGLLVDYGFDFADPRMYNGTVLADSTLMEPVTYSNLYKTLFASKFNSNAGTLRHPAIHDSLCYVARQKQVITLSGLLYQYNAINPNAQANGQLQTVNGQLRDVYSNGAWQNPYQTLTSLAISPSTIRYDLTYCSVVLPANLMVGNLTGQISGMAFDAGDGQGYRTLQYDTPIALSYADTGWKHWLFRLTLSNGQQLYSHSKVYFNNTSNAALGGGIAARGEIDQRETIIAAEAFNGGFGRADIVISYRNANDQVLRRPLIVAEGFDAGWITNPEAPEGTNTFGGFVATVRDCRSVALQNLIANEANTNAPSEYDLVYINWRNGTDWLQRNALVLEEVIRWVNARKQPDLITGQINPNVVLGSSMGGVIARMALGRMDRREGPINNLAATPFAAHQTRLYISLDAPHQGANVPLGYQAAARHAAQMYIATGTLASNIEIIQLLTNGPSPLQNLMLADQPAARQMLANRINLFYTPDNSGHQQFMQELRTQWAYPTGIRNIAISNGSECAIDQEFAPGNTLLYYSGNLATRPLGDLFGMVGGTILTGFGAPLNLTIPFIVPGTTKFEATLDIRALANGGGNRVYYGRIKYTKKIAWLVPVSINLANAEYFAPSGLLPFDTYPGGFYTITLTPPGSATPNPFFTFNSNFYLQRRFSFIPTTSALDIGQGNTTLTDANYKARYIGATPPTAPFNTPFANFATAFNQNGVPFVFDNNNTRPLNNEPHEGLYIRNANFLAAEMNGTINVRSDCSAFCGSNTIAGNPQVCSQQTFTVPTVAGATYNWSVSTPGLVNLLPSGNSVQVVRNGLADGLATLAVTIVSPVNPADPLGSCGNATLTLPLIIGRGASSVNFLTLNPVCEFAGRWTAYFYGSCKEVPSATNYEWLTRDMTNSSNPFVSRDFGTAVDFPLRPGNRNYTVRVVATTACGTLTTDQVVFAPNCTGLRMAVTPNPVSDVLTVKLLPAEGEAKASTENNITELVITDKTGNILLQRKFAKGSQLVSLPVGTLRDDVYIIKAFDGTNWISGQFVKK